MTTRRRSDLATVTTGVRLRGFIYCTFLVFVFLLGWNVLRIVVFYQNFGLENVINSIFDAGFLNTVAGGEVLRHIVITVALNAAFAAVLWWAADRWFRRHNAVARDYLGGVLLVAFGGIYWAFFVNALLYPNSQYSLLPVFAYPLVNFIVSLGLSASFLLLVLLAENPIRTGVRILKNSADAGRTALDLPWRHRHRPLAALAVMAVSLSMAVAVGAGATATVAASAGFTKSAPNIVIIGIDSLNMPLLEQPGRRAELMPNLDSYLSQSSVFRRAYTPLGRTFPAWTSILTGLYPMQNGVRANLQAVDPTRLQTLGGWLGNRGYQTTYASDEKLFSNIDERFGFDAVLGPRPGAADFLVGEFSDAPIVNLVANWRFGAALFPNLYSNRFAHYIYRPSSFVDLVAGHVRRRDREYPQFLAVHLCLPHTPYRWAEQVPKGIDRSDSAALYEYSLAAVDRQFAQIMNALQKHGLLEDALVVVMSDHGEQLAAKTLRIGASENGSESSGHRAAFGHGTDLISAEQSRILLAFRGYGSVGVRPAVDNMTTTSLVDITPTVLDVLSEKTDSNNTTDGVSLLPLLTGRVASLPLRPVFMETGLSVDAMLAETLELERVKREAAGWYRINAIGRVEIKPEVYERLVGRKQIGVIMADHLYAQQSLDGVLNEWFVRYLDDGSMVEADDVTLKVQLQQLLAEHHGNQAAVL